MKGGLPAHKKYGSLTRCLQTTSAHNKKALPEDRQGQKDLHATTAVRDQAKRFWKGGDAADQGRPAGPCPLRQRKLRASKAGWRENLSPEKVPLPRKKLPPRS